MAFALHTGGGMFKTAILASLLIGCVTESPDGSFDDGKHDDTTMTSEHATAIAACDRALAGADARDADVQIEHQECTLEANQVAASAIEERATTPPARELLETFTLQRETAEMVCRLVTEAGMLELERVTHWTCVARHERALAALIDAHVSFGDKLAKIAVAPSATLFPVCAREFEASKNAIGLATCVQLETRRQAEATLLPRIVANGGDEAGTRAALEFDLGEAYTIAGELCAVLATVGGDALRCKADAANLIGIAMLGE